MWVSGKGGKMSEWTDGRIWGCGAEKSGRDFLFVRARASEKIRKRSDVRW